MTKKASHKEKSEVVPAVQTRKFVLPELGVAVEAATAQEAVEKATSSKKENK